MFTRRHFLKVLSAAGILFAISGSKAWARLLTMTKKLQDKMTPDEALAKLIEGNKRFVSGGMKPRNLLSQVKATQTGQYPFAAIVSCLDSRVAPEYIFDQGIGDIFNARIAGNFVNADILGSLEFATKLSGSKLIVVLGHTSCGAIRGACDHVHLGHLTKTLKKLEPAVNAVKDVTGPRNGQNEEFVQKVSEKNVHLTVKAITRRSPVIREIVKQGNLKVVGAMYDISNGRVEFYS